MKKWKLKLKTLLSPFIINTEQNSVVQNFQFWPILILAESITAEFCVFERLVERIMLLLLVFHFHDN